MYTLVILGSLIYINSGSCFTLVGVSSSVGSCISGMSTIKGGKYVQTTGVVIIVSGVVIIVSDSTDNINSNSNKAMVSVDTSNSEGNNSKDTIT